MSFCSIKSLINSLKVPPQPFKVQKMTIYTQSILNAYPYFWILWWKVLEERDVFGWLPCTLGEIELFLLVILCHDFGFFIFCMIFWLRQLCFLLPRKSSQSESSRNAPNWQTEWLRVLSSQLLWLSSRAWCAL